MWMWLLGYWKGFLDTGFAQLDDVHTMSPPPGMEYEEPQLWYVAAIKYRFGVGTQVSLEIDWG